MMRTLVITGLAIALGALSGCGGVPSRPRIDAPPERPADFAVTLTSRAYPIPAPDLKVEIWGDGTASYIFQFREPHPGLAQGPFRLAPEQLDRLYAAIRNSGFFDLSEDIIADPPVPGRGVDEVVVSAAGGQHVVRSEYSSVSELDEVRAAVLEVVPPAAFEGTSLAGERKGYVVDRTSGLIYRADSAEVDEIPEANRVPFANIYEALDAGYHPAPSSHLFDGR